MLLDLHDDRSAGQVTIRQCCPSGSLNTRRGRGKLLFETVKSSELRIDRLCEFTFGQSPASFPCRGKDLPEQVMEFEPPDMEGQFLQGCFHIKIGLLFARLIEFF